MRRVEPAVEGPARRRRRVAHGRPVISSANWWRDTASGPATWRTPRRRRGQLDERPREVVDLHGAAHLVLVERRRRVVGDALVG